MEVGLPEDEVIDTLASDRFAEQVRDDEHTAGQFGISAVPTFVVDRALARPAPTRPTRCLSCCARAGGAHPVPIAMGGDTCG